MDNTSHRIKATGDAEVATYLEIAREKRGEKPQIPLEHPVERETIAVLDFGSQYSMLIARRIRECQVYCEVLPYNVSVERIKALQPRGFILSGGPSSVYDEGAPMPNPYIYETGKPVLGICYGMQLIGHQLGGKVVPGQKREYGHASLNISETGSPIFKGLESPLSVWMSHGDMIAEMPPGFRSLAYSENSPIGVMGNERGIYGLQFHPEVAHTPQGKTILKNFLFNVCGCTGNWTTGNFISQSIDSIRNQVKDGRVICALSGGVDSSVVATIIHRAIGDQLICIFVNNGLLRREEADRTLHIFKKNLQSEERKGEGTSPLQMNIVAKAVAKPNRFALREGISPPQMNIVYVDATDKFLEKLKGVIDPERKRRIIGETFIEVFEEEASKIGHVDFLAQGTLYPDVIESAPPSSSVSAKIKTHHNVGGLPSNMRLILLEPLRYLFKDEVRQVGLELGLPEEMIWRQPFPGPGLAIRIIGEITRERLEMLRSADWIVMNEIKKANFYGQLWQSFAVLTDVHSVGVMGDFRTYGNLIAIRAVTSEDAMTADWARLPYDLLARISNRVVNEVPGVNRVVYDITSKPPSTIEWE